MCSNSKWRIIQTTIIICIVYIIIRIIKHNFYNIEMKRNPVHSQQARNKVQKALLRGTKKKNKNLREKDGVMIIISMYVDKFDE